MPPSKSGVTLLRGGKPPSSALRLANAPSLPPKGNLSASPQPELQPKQLPTPMAPSVRPGPMMLLLFQHINVPASAKSAPACTYGSVSPGGTRALGIQRSAARRPQAVQSLRRARGRRPQLCSACTETGCSPGSPARQLSGSGSGDGGELFQQDLLAQRVEGKVPPHVDADGSNQVFEEGSLLVLF